jgi:hypothetical protein
MTNETIRMMAIAAMALNIALTPAWLQRQGLKQWQLVTMRVVAVAAGLGLGWMV